MGKIKEIFSVIKEEIESSAEERATYAKIEKAVEETRMAENADYVREKYRQRVYKIQAVFGTVICMLYIMAGGLAGAYITHCIFKNTGPNHGTGKMAFLQLIVNILPFCFSLKLFEIARQPLHLIIWRVKSKRYTRQFS